MNGHDDTPRSAGLPTDGLTVTICPASSRCSVGLAAMACATLLVQGCGGDDATVARDAGTDATQLDAPVLEAGGDTGGSADAAAEAATDAAPDGRASAPSSVSLPDGRGGARLDDLRFSRSLSRILAPPRGTAVDLVDPASLDVTSLSITTGDAASADDGVGLVYALDRVGGRVVVLDPTSGVLVSQTVVGASVDYLRYSHATSEVWITEPASGRIQIFTAPAAGGAPTRAGTVAVPGGPEGVTFDDERGLAFTHDEATGALVVIDVHERVVRASWPLACSGAHGIPSVDTARGFVFGGCASAQVVAFAEADGRETGRFALGGGATLTAYSSTLRHVYLRGDPGTVVVVLAVAPDGSLAELGRLDAPSQGHCITADDAGNVWLCDAMRGAVLRIADPFPETAP